MTKIVITVAAATKMPSGHVCAQGEERLLGTVAGRGEPVRAEPHPGQEGDEGELLEQVGIFDRACPPDDKGAGSSREICQCRPFSLSRSAIIRVTARACKSMQRPRRQPAPAGPFQLETTVRPSVHLCECSDNARSTRCLPEKRFSRSSPWVDSRCTSSFSVPCSPWG